MPKEQYMCQLCANHGIFNQPKKGHKQKCPYRTCPCGLCALNTKRRALDQIERQLKQGAMDYKDDPTLARINLSPCALQALPTTNVPKEIQTSAPFTVALPATINRRDLRLIKKEENASAKSLHPKTIEAVLETIKTKSIFHSAEQLAG